MAKCAKAKMKPGDYAMPSDDQLKELRESNKLVIWVLGGPGSGKGTQCDKIVAKYNFTHISTGDLLRAEVETGTERAKALNAIMKEGALVPMNVVLALLAERMIATVKTSNGFLIDGYPRELAQGQEFEKSIKPCDLVLYMKASDATLVQRLLNRGKTSGRTDDNEETIQKRLKTFHAHSDPIINNYTSKVSEIDSERDTEAIFADVVKAIDAVKK
ncbi:adenylate kinase isoenzyme 1 isoform X2 [Homalodisca vitripennis]|uniref:adenylate kinase isoenzyme 1 isoform X2 n=1 Tax=Homalodisca vitripennis TaxID=197043 RepID=UPI001EECD012|nr:adenylate kinase isoenzyme 1 isoform X2 [Homalodisca vitripennis]